MWGRKGVCSNLMVTLSLYTVTPKFKSGATSSHCLILNLLCFRVCFLGDYLISSDAITLNGTQMCTKSPSGPLFKLWCKNESLCDPYFTQHDVEERAGVPGLSVHLFKGCEFYFTCVVLC